MLDSVIQYFINLPLWELLAVVTSLLYVFFAARESILCWPMALISTTIYTVIFYDVYLWMDSVLQIYYFAMAIFGWYWWSKKNENLLTNSTEKVGVTTQIVSWPLMKHIVAIAVLSIISALVGYFMDHYTPTSFPYIDAATTVFAVFATYLVTQKVIENWHYWFVIDAVSIYIYIEKGLTPTAFLFAVYVIFVVYGYISWRQKVDSVEQHRLATTA